MARAKRLAEGFLQVVGTTVNGWFTREPESQARELSRGLSRDMTRSWDRSLSPSPSQEETFPLDRDLLVRYADYETMDEYPEIALALDLFADDATQPDMLKKKAVWAYSDDKAVELILTDLAKTLGLDKDSWALARTIAKYGNSFAEVVLGLTGVVGLNYLPTATIRRVNDCHGFLLGFYQTFEETALRGTQLEPEEFMQKLSMYRERKLAGEATDGQCRIMDNDRYVVFEPWEMVHWRLMRELRGVYGTSVLESGARWTWHRLQMLDDAVLVHKLTRAPGRYGFTIDVGDRPWEEAWSFVRMVRNEYKKKKIIDRQGRLNRKYNALMSDDDFFVPSRGGRDATRIDVLSGPDYQAMDDIDYFKNKLYASLKLPKPFAEFGEPQSKIVLANEDVRFARAVMRLQREEIEGYNKVATVHLEALNYDTARLDFTYQMTPPSSIFDLARVEVMAAKADLTTRMMEFVPMEWILTRVWSFSEDEAEWLTEKWGEERVWRMAVEGEGAAEGARLADEVSLETERKRAEQEAAMQPETEEKKKVDLKDRRLIEAINRLEVMIQKREKAERIPSGRKERELESRLERIVRSNDAVVDRLAALAPMMKELKFYARRGKAA